MRKRGYTLDFNLQENCLQCTSEGLELSPEDFEVVEVYRFEGMTDPADSSVLYAIESTDGLKGMLVNAYGVYANTASAELIAKLDIKNR